MLLNDMPLDPYADDPMAWMFILFRRLPAFPGYGADSEGTIWTCKCRGPHVRYAEKWTRKITNATSHAYAMVNLRQDGRYKMRSVHTLVLEAFFGPPGPGQEGCHYPDPDPRNNRLRNLRWDNRQGNVDDRMVHDRTAMGERNGRAKLSADDVQAILGLRSDGVRVVEIARRYSVGTGAIYDIVSGRRWAGSLIALSRPRRVRVV